MPKRRLEAFSDGVIAVAITVLALDLPVPEPSGGRSLAHELAGRWPSFAAFAVSFLTIGSSGSTTTRCSPGWHRSISARCC